MKLLIFGGGYVGTALAKSMASDTEIVATNRSGVAAGSLDLPHITWQPFQKGYPLSKDIFAHVTHCLISIPPTTSESNVVLDLHGKDLIAAQKLAWLGYLSSTGVYGDHEGRVVTEESKCLPTNPTTQRRFEDERNLKDFAREHGLPLHIFRLGGIYGPYRNVLSQLKKGMAVKIYAPGHPFSRIHVEDIVRYLSFSMEYPTPGEVFNLVDEGPAPTCELIDYACFLLKKPLLAEVPLERANISPRLKEMYHDRRVVKGEKVQKTFNLPLRFSTYREGLKHIHEKGLY